jgi:hypothetical protein
MGQVLAVRFAFDALFGLGQSVAYAWVYVTRLEARKMASLTPNKVMTADEAMRILGLQKPFTRTMMMERYKLLHSKNDELGSLYIRHKVEISKQTLEKEFRI